MFRPAIRVAAGAAPLLRSLPRQSRRLISTAPPHQTSRSWKSSAGRWALAGAAIYYYNTSTAFAEEPAYAVHDPPQASREVEVYPTVESVSEKRRKRTAGAQKSPLKDEQSRSEYVAAVPDGEVLAPGSPDALEEEAEQQGAFNEETGEINWDCPCLGGMAHGPCGEQFRAAFSCFVFSKEEPKGVDCIEHFKTMQNCFREHPDIYGSELEDDEQQHEGQPQSLTGEESESQPIPAHATEPSKNSLSEKKSASGPSGLVQEASEKLSAASEVISDGVQDKLPAAVGGSSK